LRGKILFFFFLVLIPLISLRYFQLQIIEGKKYKEYIDSLGIEKRAIPPLRGRIYSSDGKILAESENTQIALLMGRKIPNRRKLERIMGRERTTKLLLGESVEVNESEAKELKKIGVLIFKDVKRVYSGIAPHVVGYIKKDGTGIYGVEKILNEELKGVPGSELLMVDLEGKVVGRLVSSPPINGKDVILTINSKLQKYAQNLLQGLRGTVILMKVKTGEILAMASSPIFDPNKISKGISPREWRKILNDPEGTFLNRAISALYPPGSAIKPFIALSYLNTFKGEDEVVDCKGTFQYKSKSGKVAAVYKDWLLSGHGITDLRKAIRVSCNVYFYTIGLKLGIDRLKEMAEKVKLDHLTGIDLPGEKKGLFPSREWKFTTFKRDWYPGDTILISIGQGYLRLTPIELATFYMLLANEGISYTPYVIKKVGSKEKKPKIFLKFDAPKEVWDFLREAMIEVTSYPGNLKEEGTAYKVFKDFPIPVAGKTGTAEAGRGDPHSWFVGYAPACNPEVVVLAVVEHGGPGSRIAAPIAKKMLEKYFSIFKPSGDLIKCKIKSRHEKECEEGSNTQTTNHRESHRSVILFPFTSQDELRNEGSYSGERSH